MYNYNIPVFIVLPFITLLCYILIQVISSCSQRLS